MKRRLAWLAAVVLLAVPVQARAQIGGIGLVDRLCDRGDSGITAPGAVFILALAGESGGCVNVSDEIVTEGKLASLHLEDFNVLDLGTVDLSVTMNSDPFISFGATTTNFVAGPVTYGFLFGTPVVPGFYTTASSTGGLSLTNAPGGAATVTSPGLYPTYISGYGTNGAVATNLGVDLGTASCTAGGATTVATTTCNYGSATNTFAPAFYDNLEALLTYNQSELASVASWSGSVTLGTASTVTPEPMTLTLLATGLAGVAVARRRRRGRALPS